MFFTVRSFPSKRFALYEATTSLHESLDSLKCLTVSGELRSLETGFDVRS